MASLVLDASEREDNPADATAIQQLYRQLLAAWGRGDGAGYAALFTDDADYVAFDGSHTVGRAAIGAAHQALFDTWLRGTRLVGMVNDARFLSPSVVVAHATGGMIMPGRNAPSPARASIQTLVAVNGPSGWRFATFHNTRIQRHSRLGMILFGIVTKVFRR
ncbi:MAG TPA: SgcJ/EcaC family oxidoreductase [Thermomicrobiales bacterium]|jgi:uncharacterized protein (TIGR02246 family)